MQRTRTRTTRGKPSSPSCMGGKGPFMHAGHPPITWGENSPPATVPCVPCAPGSRESVSSHRYHTNTNTTPQSLSVVVRVCCLPVCLCLPPPPVCPLLICPVYPCAYLATCPCSRCLCQQGGYFWRQSSLFCFGPLLPPRVLRGEASSHVTAARIVADSHTHTHQPGPSARPGPSMLRSHPGPTRAWIL